MMLSYFGRLRRLGAPLLFTARLFGVTLLSLLYMFTSTQLASAMSAEQSRAMELGLFKVDAERPCEETAASGVSMGTLPTDASSTQRLQYIYTWFRGKGLTAIQAAAAVGNIAVESGGIANRVQGSGMRTSNDPAAAGSGGWGLIQWTPGSKVIGIAQKAGITGPIYETDTQLAIVLWHMKNLSATGVTNMLAGYNQTDIAAAVHYYERTMEGAGKPAYSARTARAKIALQQYESASNQALWSSLHPTMGQTTPNNMWSASGTSATTTDSANGTSADSSALAATSLQQAGCAPSVSGDTAPNPTDEGLVSLIQKYAWPTKDHNPTGEQTEAYRAATAAAKALKKYIGGANGNDCGAFITRLMQNSGRDPNYTGNTSQQMTYLKNHPELYRPLKRDEPKKFGDIGIFTGHVFMYIGNGVPGFKAPIVEAALRDPPKPSSAPRNIDSLNYNNGHGAIYYRYIGGVSAL